ncbi:MAG: 30S ribosomal protein S12 methylthiotransferase RimO [Bacteroidales bacterium]|nr:30S ribosomal protein S12 methylthiotransferase RimO [Bacteroidales bacterium]MBN2820224.1 30S ribosomal protein S12 methylthiotransferase RimO [Bacteroidales bacterium]
MRTKQKSNKINLVTLGCSKNTVDSEKLSGQLKANNLEVIYDADARSARTVVINTCGFIADAKEESINTILEYVEAKQQGLIDRVYVMGCLSERYKKELPSEIPEVDAMFGVNNLKDIVEILGGNYKKELLGERILSTPSHYAYLKISEGCDRNCSFCAIPLIRGKHKSVLKEALVDEAKSLVSQGVKELILIAQDLTYYGIDIYKKQALADLLKELSDIDGLKWIRLHYAYPSAFPKDVLQVMRERENICNYLDIPFQHVSDNVLKNMRRGVNSSQTYELIRQFRSEIPELILRTTLLVGHPGETEQDFEQLKEFVREVKFDRLGVFTYSEEEDTWAAEKFRDDIPQEVKEQRAAEIMEIQEEISLKKNEAKIGKVYTVIIDRQEGDYWVARTEGDSPEVDNEVLISTGKKLDTGKFYKVKVIAADIFDIYACVHLSCQQLHEDAF